MSSLTTAQLSRVPVIETAGLRKAYGSTRAVDGIDLTVHGGEVFGFLGPNGAGKTTTVKILLGLVHPTGGTARVLGCDPGDPAAMRRIGFLPEHFRFPPWLTAAGFLEMNAQLYGLTAREQAERVPQLLGRVGLGQRSRSRLGEFSKGMQQRLGLAQALLNDPELVFLDEPTSGLDPIGRREVRDLIHELRQKGVTVFVNSHFLSEVEVTCDRVAIVKRGRVVRAGTLDELTRGALEVEIRASGLSQAILGGLGRWGQVNETSVLPYTQTPAHPDDPGPVRPVPARVRLTVESEAVLPAVASYLVENGAQLYALAPQRLSLEELFMRVMAEEPES